MLDGAGTGLCRGEQEGSCEILGLDPDLQFWSFLSASPSILIPTPLTKVLFYSSVLLGFQKLEVLDSTTVCDSADRSLWGMSKMRTGPLGKLGSLKGSFPAAFPPSFSRWWWPWLGFTSGIAQQLSIVSGRWAASGGRILLSPFLFSLLWSKL